MELYGLYKQFRAFRSPYAIDGKIYFTNDLNLCHLFPVKYSEHGWGLLHPFNLRIAPASVNRSLSDAPALYGLSTEDFERLPTTDKSLKEGILALMDTRGIEGLPPVAQPSGAVPDFKSKVYSLEDVLFYEINRTGCIPDGYSPTLSRIRTYQGIEFVRLATSADDDLEAINKAAMPYFQKMLLGHTEEVTSWYPEEQRRLLQGRYSEYLNRGFVS
ncbi:hypothetical protein [Aestuariirhabdus sp. LZHN29]|uniref:hypothetical protein n=1 Tax=Aestuariirhabdus sp. LZHN29 TaxID=3417462 RepID=UPI003CF1C12E